MFNLVPSICVRTFAAFCLSCHKSQGLDAWHLPKLCFWLSLEGLCKGVPNKALEFWVSSFRIHQPEKFSLFRVLTIHSPAFLVTSAGEYLHVRYQDTAFNQFPPSSFMKSFKNYHVLFAAPFLSPFFVGEIWIRPLFLTAASIH